MCGGLKRMDKYSVVYRTNDYAVVEIGETGIYQIRPYNFKRVDMNDYTSLKEAVAAVKKRKIN
jgi:hypothetical protein